jgi:hypothetical protein
MIFVAGKEIGTKHLMEGLYKVLDKAVESSLLQALSAEDWHCIFSHKKISKRIWDNLNLWAKRSLDLEKQLPMILKDAKDVSLYRLNEEDRVDLFLIGKNNGNKRLAEGFAFQFICNDIEITTLEIITPYDWEFIMADQIVNRVVLDNFMTWMKLDAEHEARLP